MNMGLLYPVAMVLSTASTHRYSHIRWTTLRSRFHSCLPEFSLTSCPLYRVLIASICNLRTCPCPWCTMTMVNVPQMGMPEDMSQQQCLVHIDDDNQQRKVLQAWKLIYRKHLATNSLQIEALLKDESLIPTKVIMSWIATSMYLHWLLQNTFSDRLHAFDFNLFTMLVVDLMHKFELGVWKATFTHLLHMLESMKGGKLCELDQRYVFYTLLSWPFNCSPYLQILPGPYLWKRYNLLILNECVRDEKNGGMRFRRPPPGTIIV